MKINDIIKILIEDMGNSGEGIGHYSGLTVFVKGAVLGDEVSARILVIKKNYAVAELFDIISASPFRVKPRCSVADKCGGCQLQQISYPKQLELKRNHVENSLRRIGGFKDFTIDRIIGMENPFNYRNKVQIPIREKDGELVFGFYENKSHNIIDSTDCVIQAPAAREIIEIVKEFASAHNLKAYDEKTGTGILRHLVIRTSASSGEIMVALVINADSLSLEICNDFVNKLCKHKQISSILLNTNSADTNVILGEKTTLLFGKPYITDSINGIKFRISLHSFFQINPIQTSKLYNLVKEMADIKSGETVFDLYSGIGTISLTLASVASSVYGVEIVKPAVDDARQNALLNSINNAKFYEGAAETVVPKLYKQGIKADVVVVDPPRRGLAQGLLDTISDMAPSRIVYVSCDPATLARDLKFLSSSGYTITRATSVDMFPFTTHVESVVLLNKVQNPITYLNPQ